MTRRILLPAILPAAIVLLATAAAVPALAGGGCHGSPGAVATEATSRVVKIDGCTFAPTITRVPVGTEVMFLNTGLAPHDVTGTRAEWGSQRLEPGESYSKRFAAPGIYAYSCSLHPGMAGVIVAGERAPAVAAPETPTESPAVSEPADATAAASAASTGQGSALAMVAVGGAGLALGGLGSALLLRRRDADD